MTDDMLVAFKGLLCVELKKKQRDLVPRIGTSGYTNLYFVLEQRAFVKAELFGSL